MGLGRVLLGHKKVVVMVIMNNNSDSTNMKANT
jgi:hypothetical protein